jgi:hypothetical protein
MNVGDTFMHPQWGRGRILEFLVRGGKAYARVQFGWATDSIPLSEIPGAKLPPTLVFPRDEPPTRGRDQLSSDVARAKSELTISRIGVQSLRLGQITDGHVSALSVGTAAFEASAGAALDAASANHPQYVMIEGAWGTGKTHLLTLLAAHASQRGFAVSSTILDGCLYSLTDPLRLLESITTQMRFPGDAIPTGAVSRLKRVKTQGRPELRSLGGERINKIVREISEALIDDGEAVGILEDYMGLSMTPAAAKERLSRLGYRGIQLPPLKARAKDERGIRFVELLQDWAAYSVAAGAKGLLVVLDELDVEYANAGWGSVRTRRDELLAALSRSKAARSPLIIAFASAPSGDDDDPDNDAVADIARKLELDFHQKAASINAQDLLELGARIYELYGKAYPGFAKKLNKTQQAAVCRQLIKRYNANLSPVPRRYIRSLLHCFDMIDLGQKSIDQVLKAAS